MIGQTLGHYRILEQIGAGGMGVVYRAHDERLDREVALKVLPPSTLTDENARRRFRKEALTLSKLNHPNIETVFDFDTQDGVDFLVMELIPGVTLDEKLAAGALPEKEVIRLGAQLTEGLAAAHAEGVIHRDLKPGNLRLTPDGRLKILDFGLAKLLRPVSDVAVTESLSQTRGAVGTLPYMAPEQLQGEPADARSDIWAAGAVLYEMAAGRRPFPQTSSPMLTDAILRQAPVPPRAVNANLSPELERIISKSLEKDPEHRYQSAKELGVDLRRLGMPAAASAALAAPARKPWMWALVAAGIAAGLGLATVAGVSLWQWLRPPAQSGPPRIESLAVLPLQNLSGDPQQEYFADGMTEELIAELSKIGALKVISRTSVMQYKGAKKPMPQIARELGADALIEGSVLREGDEVRITVQLIHGPTDRHLWTESYQRKMRGILVLQSEVAQAIAREIQIKVAPQEQARLASARPVNPEAYALYLKGRFHWNKRREEDLQKGLGYFQQAIEKDPGFALAYVGIADSYNVLPIMGSLPGSEAYPKARVAAIQALEIDDTLAEAHTSLAWVKWRLDRDWVGAESEFKRALELKPNSAPAHHWYALYLTVMGRMEESLREIKRAQQLDPLSLIINANVAWVYLYARQYDQALRECRKTLEMDANFAQAHNYAGVAYVYKGMYEEAIAEFRKAIALADARPAVYVGGLAYTYARAGKKGEAEKLLKELLERRHIPANDVARVYVGLGKREEALAWLEKAYEDRGSDFDFIKVAVWPDPLRSDPRFQDLLRRMNFPQ